VIDIIISAVDIKMEFVVNALPVELIGMSSIMMCNYIKFCTNQLLIALCCSKYYTIGNPFDWMETISLQGKTNFFGKHISKYSISGVGVERAYQTFALHASF
jgi:ribonucleotide reductase beta subunit family protein with ferritin-like domain